MNEVSVESRVREIVAKNVDIDAREIDRSADLQALDIESLDLIEIIFEIEETFDINIDQDDKSANLTTIGEMLDWLTANIEAQKTA